MCVGKISSILQSLAPSILTRLIAAVSGLGSAFNNIDNARHRMPVYRSRSGGRIGHLGHDEFAVIAWYRETFQNPA
jgi:hypothetical protein